MTFSEAIEAVGRLISAFPNGTPQDPKGYIGALSGILLEYPRSIALRCADLRLGVARETRFLPTVADLVAWCERETASMRGIVETEDREARIIREMEARRLESEKIEASRRARPSYDELKAKHGPNWGLKGAAEIDHAAKAAQRAQLDRANERVLAKAYAAAGAEPAGALSASPLLAAVIRQQDAYRAAIPSDTRDRTKPAYDGGPTMQRVGALARHVIEDAPPASRDDFPVDTSEIPF